jgi:hypothetical protein
MAKSSYVELVDDDVPIFARPSNCLPRNSIFKTLRAQWLKLDSSRKSKDLAALLDQPAQAISQWCTGSDDREPPWWAILRVCHETGHYLEISPSKVRIKKLTSED